MEDFFAMILPRDHVLRLVSEMREAGFDVSETGLGYICHKQTPYGLMLVMSALRGRDMYRIKANKAFFEQTEIVSPARQQVEIN